MDDSGLSATGPETNEDDLRVSSPEADPQAHSRAADEQRNRKVRTARELSGEHAPGNDNGTGAEPKLPSIRKLLNRHRRRLARSGGLPSLKEIELLLKLERHLAQEELEHLNALTREVG
jgi:hypothetical protein